MWAGLLLGLVPAALPAQPQEAASGDLAARARQATAFLTNHQQAPGYWLTSYTDQARFERPHAEMNTFLTSVIVDVVKPVAAAAGLDKSLERARIICRSNRRGDSFATMAVRTLPRSRPSVAVSLRTPTIPPSFGGSLPARTASYCLERLRPSDSIARRKASTGPGLRREIALSALIRERIRTLPT